MSTLSAPRTGGGKGGGGRNQNNIKYGTPLPLLLPTSALHPSSHYQRRETERMEAKEGIAGPGPVTSCLRYFRNVWSSEPTMQKTVIKGHFDIHTRSVWITDDNVPNGDTPDPRSTPLTRKRLLFERGFFGKGSLSRSDPSWKIRRVKTLKAEREAKLAEHEAMQEGADSSKRRVPLTAEEVTRQRRLERKQFKIDRAQAILDASLAAEAILRSAADAEKKRAELEAAAEAQAEDEMGDADDAASISSKTRSTARPGNGLREDLADNASVTVPSLEGYQEHLPEGVDRLTPQTFLQRPTRPAGSTPSRGRPKKKPPKPTPAEGQAPQPKPEQIAARPEPRPRPPRDEDLLDEFADVEDLEHLQLNLEETLFLGWALGCLQVYDQQQAMVHTPTSLLARILSLPQPVRSSFQLPAAPRPDHPFLISYAAYHHYRSLGWVVKPGLKFCCDWLLYKKGPVFSHADFALLILPHWEDAEDAQTCPYSISNADPMTWQWLNTVNRVNTTVKKTLVLAYVTIPSSKTIGAIDFERPEVLFCKYRVSEIVVRRFGPARMRD